MNSWCTHSEFTAPSGCKQHVLTKATSLKNSLCHGIGLEVLERSTILVSGYQAITHSVV